MNFQEHPIAALQELGYTQREAEFLYLAATHSGYFLQRQFDRYAQVQRGGAVLDFLHKALCKRHFKVETFARKSQLYNICSRQIFNAIGAPNSRSRQTHSLTAIKMKLLALDFVLAHLANHFLETEHDKVHYFTELRQIDRHLLPTTVYRSADKKSSTARHFVDRFPIFLPADGDETAPVTFTYIDDTTTSIGSFETYLNYYNALFRALKTFHLIFVSNQALHFDEAKAGFYSHFNIIDLAVAIL